MIFSQRHFSYNVIAKPIGPVCNMACSYCYYLSKKYLYHAGTHFRLSEQILEMFIKQYIESNDTPAVTFAWQGGEPTLLGLEYFNKIIELQKKYSDGKQIINALQTNGLYIDEFWCNFFAKNQFLIGVSIDGPEKYHNRYRKTSGGRGTFKKVIKAVETLIQFGVDFNTLTTVNRANQHSGRKIYAFLKEIGSRYIQFIPIVERQKRQADKKSSSQTMAEREAAIAPWAVEPEAYGQFLIDVFEAWVRADVGETFIQLFDVTLENWMGIQPGLCLFSEQCGTALAMEQNGDIFSCDHFVFDAYKLGNINNDRLIDLTQSDTQIEFGKNKKTSLPKQCFQCNVRFLCHGECPKNRFSKTSDGENGLNYLCSGYRNFFCHTAPHMKFMANEIFHGRLASNIMYNDNMGVQRAQPFGGVQGQSPCRGPGGSAP